MVQNFYERPILNSRYLAPKLRHPLDDNGQPLDGEPIKDRWPSKCIAPVPVARKHPSAARVNPDLETYPPNPLIHGIRSHLDSWRKVPNPASAKCN